MKIAGIAVMVFSVIVCVCSLRAGAQADRDAEEIMKREAEKEDNRGEF